MEYSIQGYIHTIIEANSKEEAERIFNTMQINQIEGVEIDDICRA